jgi:succinyl-diaminopimelate desuccinylase
VSELVAPVLDPAGGDSVEVVESAPAAPPGLDHPLLRRLVDATGQAPRAKLGWTDVALFTERGVPATNFGPGDPALAHAAGERVHRSEVERAYQLIAELMAG